MVIIVNVVDNSGPLVHGYILNTVKGPKITCINTKKIKYRACQLIPANKLEYKSGLGPLVTVNLKHMNTMNVRHAMSYAVLEQIETKSLEEMQVGFVKMIVEIRPMKPDGTLFVEENKPDRRV